MTRNLPWSREYSDLGVLQDIIGGAEYVHDGNLQKAACEFITQMIGRIIKNTGDPTWDHEYSQLYAFRDIMKVVEWTVGNRKVMYGLVAEMLGEVVANCADEHIAARCL